MPHTTEARTLLHPLPEAYALSRIDEELIAGLDAEGRMIGVQVDGCAVGPMAARRVMADQNRLPQVFVADRGSPELGPSHEETLLACEAIDDRGRLVSKRDAIRANRQRKAAEIADVLRKRHIPVQAAIPTGVVPVELCDQPPGAL